MVAQWVIEARRAGPQGLNVLREKIQWEIIGELSKRDAFRSVAFMGGTCLRLIHGLNRFSEDLDFSAIDSGAETKMAGWLNAVHQRLESYGLPVSFKVGDTTKTVVKGEIAVSGILKTAGISPLESQKIAIKLEVDTNPPQNWITKTEIRMKPNLMAVTTFDMPSLMAGKTHALLARPWSKGRDWYDLLWYLSRGVEPNLPMLQSSLNQMPSAYTGDAEDWKNGITKRSQNTDWEQVSEDVRRFLQNPAECEMLSEDVVNAALESGFSI